MNHTQANADPNNKSGLAQLNFCMDIGKRIIAR